MFKLNQNKTFFLNFNIESIVNFEAEETNLNCHAYAAIFALILLSSYKNIEILIKSIFVLFSA